MTACGKPVLLIVDECEVRCLLKDIYFSEFGMNVTSTSDGTVALSKCSEQCPDVALVSISLEGDLDAIDTIRGLKERSETQIIVLTDASATSASQHAERAASAIAAGADMFVIQPCLPDVLLRHVKRLLALKRPPAGHETDEETGAAPESLIHAIADELTALDPIA